MVVAATQGGARPSRPGLRRPLAERKTTRMRISHAPFRRLGLVGPLALCGGLLAPSADAQTPEQPVVPATPPVAPETPPAEAAKPVEPVAVSANEDLAALRAALAETQKQLEEVQLRQDEAEASAASSATDAQPSLKIYGFADMGIQHQWVKKSSPVANVFPTNSTSFVVGNINLYFDAQPFEHWRGLVELRFTNAPQGDPMTFGGIAGTFRRRDNSSYDSGGTAVNAPMWGATLIIERAWVEWNQLQAFKLRVGNWFTPFGIWNEDHGTPTLISLVLPQFILQRWIPIRQTGLMAYGNAFAGDWELGYALTFSNGRQEISNTNFDDKFGYGGRVYARRDTGAINGTLGLSYFTGTTSEQSIDLTGLDPIEFEQRKTWEYNEHVLGVDVALDVDATRIRAEAMLRRQTFTPGHRIAGDPAFALGSVEPDKWQQSAYLLVANQLPWLGIEPFLWGELLEAPSVVGDGVVVGSVGVNVHFNPAVQLKTQVTRVVFFDWLYDSPFDNSVNNLSAVYSRLVMAF